MILTHRSFNNQRFRSHAVSSHLQVAGQFSICSKRMQILSRICFGNIDDDIYHLITFVVLHLAKPHHHF